MTDRDSKKKIIASRIRIARERSGLSQGQAAKLLNLHRPTISEVEAGRRKVSAEELAEFSSLYGVSLDWLSGINVDKTDPLKDRVELAARELTKLKQEDLESVLDFLNAIQKSRK